MNKFLKSYFRRLSNFIFGTRRRTTKCIKKIAEITVDKKILEIGSGKQVKKRYPYSYYDLFKENNEFIMSDINPSFGHKVIDATKMNFNEEFDMILCLNVLEHIYDFEKAIKNMHKALKREGEIAVFIAFIYPLHDEPTDFFRYSEYALKRMFNEFKDIRIRHFGIRQFPKAYFLTAKK